MSQETASGYTEYIWIIGDKPVRGYIKDGDEPIFGNRVGILRPDLLHYCPHCKIAWPMSSGSICPKSKDSDCKHFKMAPEKLGTKTNIYNFSDYSLYKENI